MKLEFEQNLVSERLNRELGFKAFLALVDLDLPMIAHKVLYALDGPSGTAHFDYLRQLDRCILDEQVQEPGTDIQTLVSQAGRLPALDEILPFFETAKLEQFHLYQLGLFIAENEKLADLEEHFPLDGELEHPLGGILPKTAFTCCAKISAVLTRYMRTGFSNLKLSAEERELQQQISRAETALATELGRYEEQIHTQTGLKMIYPFPKEVALDAPNIDRLKACPLVSVSERHNLFLIDYKLIPAVKEQIAAKDALIEQFAHSMNRKLVDINGELRSFFKDFKGYYEKRKQRAYHYALLWVKNRHGLCLPEFGDAAGSVFKKARLPYLEQQLPYYVPLDIELNQGANLLFGGNMTGKTTVLKTLYFHLALIRTGFPVPAAYVRLHFPEAADMHLKTSGDLRRSLSGFGEEIQFFCKDPVPYAFILSDELFQSTDPVSGVELSKIFISEYAGFEGVFLCTSHYPEVLSFKDLTLFRMSDAQVAENGKGSVAPYAVESVSADRIDEVLQQSFRPMQLALQFPLSESIKAKIRTQLSKQQRKD